MRRHGRLRSLRWLRWLRGDARAGPLAICLLVLGALPGCRITPDEIQRIETENDLLREQIRTMRMECEQYRQLQLEIEEPGAAPPQPEASPDRPSSTPR